jgi:hypothetical protein
MAQDAMSDLIGRSGTAIDSLFKRTLNDKLQITKASGRALLN